MYYFDILKLLEKRKRLSANDIWFILNSKGGTPNIHNIRKTLLKMFVSVDRIDRVIVTSGSGYNFYYFIKRG